MIEVLACIGLLSCGFCIALFMSKRTPAMRVVLPGDPLYQTKAASTIPWSGTIVPGDATHIAWIMFGAGQIGTVHTLYLQTLTNLHEEIRTAGSPIGPVIVHSVELETDIRGRGCVPTSEVMYAVVRVDDEGNETWLGRSGDWVARWAPDAQLYEVFPGAVR